MSTEYLGFLRSVPEHMLEKCSKLLVTDRDNTKDIDNYKEFAGWNVKYLMLEYAVNHFQMNKSQKVNFLLDLASGRGNDSQKWAKILKKTGSLGTIIGIEYDKDQVKEAISRYKSMKGKGKIPNIRYILGSAYDKTLINKNIKGKINLITCNFAINYFYESEKIANTFMDIVSNKLRDGGIFIGAAADGDVISSLFKIMDKDEIKDEQFYIKYGDNFSQSSSKTFGNNYQFALTTPYFEKNGEQNLSSEYLIRKNSLVTLARKYKLVPYAIIPNVSAISNLVYFPLSKKETGKDKGRANHKRSFKVASLFFAFSFIKASNELLNNIDNPKGVIIIPYRNTPDRLRWKQLQKSIKSFPNLDIIVVEQNDNELFNRGLLIDVGAKVSKTLSNYNYYIFHDVDLIPDNDLIPYYFKYPVNPIHIGARGQRYSEEENILDGINMKYGHFLGGVLSINCDDFEKVNGYPYIKFKGWGGEDDAFRNRLLNNGIAYTRPSSGKVYDLEEMGWQQKKERLDKENLRMSGDKKRELVKQDYKDYNRDGVNNVVVNNNNTVVEDRVISGRDVKWVKYG